MTTAVETVDYARKLANAFRQEGWEHAAIGNETQAWTCRVSAIVLEGFVLRAEGELTRVRPELSLELLDELAFAQQAQEKAV